MPVTSIASDPEALTLTAIGDYPVPVERLWRAWADPRQLERFWGPPEYPATFSRHELKVGARSKYSMTGPQGQTHHCYWDVKAVEPERRFVVENGFADADGNPQGGLPPMLMEVRFEATETGSRFVACSTYPSLEAMEQFVGMGMIEGMSSALTQLDEVLADLHRFSAEMTASLVSTSPTEVVVRRIVRGALEQVWRCHHEPELLQRWLLGPDGWTMPVCEVAREVGDSYRYEWEHETNGQRFGFTGELLESEAPARAVTTERMIGAEGEPSRNELRLVPKPGTRTLIEVRITYPSREVRDAVLRAGMVGGMETSYARLDREVLDVAAVA